MKQGVTKRRQPRAYPSMAGASGLALIMGLVNVATAADTTVTMPLVGSITLNQGAADKVGTPQTSLSSATSKVQGKHFAGPGNIPIIDNTAESIARNNKTGTETIISTIAPGASFSVVSAQRADYLLFQKVSSLVSGPFVTVTFSGPVTSTVVARNTARAESGANQAVIDIEHDSLSGFDSDTAGAATLSSPILGTSKATVSANGALVNVQRTRSLTLAAPSAEVRGATITVDATSNKFSEGSSISVIDNTISAAYTANDADIAYRGSGTNLDGSIMIANLQENTQAAPAAKASVVDSGVSINTGDKAINGRVVLSGHTIEAGAGGNRASNTAALRLDGALVGQSGAELGLGTAANALGTAAKVENANLGIASVQRNSNAHFQSAISGSDMVVSGTGGEGSIVLRNNRSLAGSTGNEVDNIIALSAASVSDAGVGIANVQSNLLSSVTADNNTNILVASTVPATGNPTALQHKGRVVLTRNEVSSAAIGSTALNAIGALEDGGLGMVDSAEFAITNQQQADAMAVTANTVGNVAAIVAPKGSTTPMTSVTSNQVSSHALGQVAHNEISLSSLAVEDGSAWIDNEQSRNLGPISASTQGRIALIVQDSANQGGPLSLARNTLSAAAGANQAGNRLQLAGDTTLGLEEAAISNRQSSSGAVTASLDGMISLLATGTIGGNSSVVSNVLLSFAFANTADNALIAQAGTHVTAGKFDLNNQQTSHSAVSADTKGRVLIDTIDVLPNDSLRVNGRASVRDNLIAAGAAQNEASNLVALAADSVTSAEVSLSNTQISSGASSADTLTGSRGFGIYSTDGKALSGIASVNDNTVRSLAAGNLATNELLMSAQSAETTTLGLANEQAHTGGAITATTTIGPGLGVLLHGNLDGSATVADNELQSLAYANRASNQLQLTGDQLTTGSEASLNSTQRNTGNVSSQLVMEGTYGLGIGSLGNISGQAVVQGNQIVSSAIANEAENRLSQHGLANSAKLSLDNLQRNTGTVSASTRLDSGVGVEAGGTMNQATVAVRHNTIESLAAANRADNALSLSATIGHANDASIENDQHNNASVQSSFEFGEYASIGVYGNKLTNTNAIVSDNTITARSYGNSASNALNAQVAAGPLNGELGIINRQINSGPVTATVNGPSSSNAVDIVMNSAGQGNHTLLAGNTIAATAYGNLAFNDLSASSLLGASGASHEVVSRQLNTGNVTATVSNAGMGISGTGAGTGAIRDNTISATAVGNASFTRMVISD